LIYKPTGRPVSAILPVHQMGMPCDIWSVIDIVNEFKLPVIEDAACAIGVEISSDGRTWETIGKPHGDIACFSFHPRKVITTGDGGMLTTNRDDLIEKFRLLRQHGMSISDRLRHESDKVVFESYPILGYNYRMTDIQAAIGIEQFKKLPDMIRNRRQIETWYRKHLSSIEWLQLPPEPEHVRTNWQSYPVRVLPGAPLSRDELMQFFMDRGISTRAGIMNAHSEPVYSHIDISLPDSEQAREQVILFPFYIGLSENDIERIRQTIQEAG
jgi:dTDP-4-amino-4,6-dideoxygalactose transaminase